MKAIDRHQRPAIGPVDHEVVDRLVGILGAEEEADGAFFGGHRAPDDAEAVKADGDLDAALPQRTYE